MIITNVYCVGAGGTASHLIPNATRLMAYHQHGANALWKIQDGDDFEEANHNRQVFRHQDAGRNKAIVLAERVGDMVASGLEVDPTWCGKAQIIRWLHDLHFAQAERSEADLEPSVGLILTLVDNYKTRAEIYQAIAEVPGADVVVIDPGNDLHNGQVNTYIRTSQDQMWESPLVKSPLIRKPPDRKPADGCVELTPSTPQLMLANIMAATLSLQALWAVLTDFEYPLYEQQEFDLMQEPVAIKRGGVLFIEGEENDE